ncbi:MAG TPA: AraC family transcriptional regulator [Thermoanaerobaculia bacterium]|nr:AraC family transcriptional regulator [Thermoanaerobaculia bacterium]
MASLEVSSALALPSAASFAVGVAVDPLFATELFRIGRWRCVVGPSESTAIQAQRWPMISFTHAGAFVVHSGGRSAVIDPTCTLLINPGAPYRMSRHFGERSHGAYVLVRPDVFADVARTASEARAEGFAGIEGPSSTRSYLLQRSLLDRIRSVPGPDALEVDEMAMALVEAAFRPRGRADSEVTPRQRARIDRARALILENLSAPLKLDDVARGIALSPFHLCRLFRRSTGRTLHRYRTALRLRIALERIADPGIDLAALSLELGYSSHSHFTAAFRKEFGVSPSKIRGRGNAERLRALIREWDAGPAFPCREPPEPSRKKESGQLSST